MNTQHTITEIGNSMKHWANYIHDVKRGAIINEGAIKYGISEYLVASGSFADYPYRNTNLGVPQIQKIKFERTHDLFKNRRIDLSFNIDDGENVIEVFFEFKYLNSAHLPEHEKDRYINDLFRLAALAKHYNESKKCECYFMLVGKPKKVEQLVIGNVTDTEHRRDNIKGLPKDNNSEIKDCFALEENGIKEVVLGDLSNGKGVSHLNRFEQDYKYRDEIKKQSKLDESDCMMISLKYSTPSNEEVGVYIWQVKI